MINGRTVSRDRWLIDVFASETFKGVELPQVSSEILQPDLSVILLCEEAVRQERVRSRPNPTVDDLTPKIEGTRSDYFEGYLLKHISEFALCSMVIDTTRNTAIDTASVILAELGISHNE